MHTIVSRYFTINMSEDEKWDIKEDLLTDIQSELQNLDLKDEDIRTIIGITNITLECYWSKICSQ